MKENHLSVSEAALIISDVGDQWIKNSSGKSIFAVTRNAAKKLSKDPIFNLAAYMKHEFPSMSGCTDEDWIQAAKDAQKILGGAQ